jgi:hypothetical protein
MVGIEVELAVPIDVFEVGLHAISITPTAGNLDQDFPSAAPGGAHAFRPSDG